jgi:hypothetical protein
VKGNARYPHHGDWTTAAANRSDQRAQGFAPILPLLRVTFLTGHIDRPDPLPEGRSDAYRLLDAAERRAWCMLGNTVPWGPFDAVAMKATGTAGNKGR